MSCCCWEKLRNPPLVSPFLSYVDMSPAGGSWAWPDGSAGGRWTYLSFPRCFYSADDEFCLAAKNLWCSKLAHLTPSLLSLQKMQCKTLFCAVPGLLAELDGTQKTPWYPTLWTPCPAGFSGNKLHFQSALCWKSICVQGLWPATFQLLF